MSAENEVYQEGTRLMRELTALRNSLQEVNASDTACKAEALAAVEEAREGLRRALARIAALV